MPTQQPDQALGAAPRPERPDILDVARLRALAQEGRRPDPARFQQALAAARARVRGLAAALLASPAAGQAELAAYEQALALCQDLTLLGLELTRRHGPDFLPAPYEAP